MCSVYHKTGDLSSLFNVFRGFQQALFYTNQLKVYHGTVPVSVRKTSSSTAIPEDRGGLMERQAGKNQSKTNPRTSRRSKRLMRNPKAMEKESILSMTGLITPTTQLCFSIQARAETLSTHPLRQRDRLDLKTSQRVQRLFRSGSIHVDTLDR